MSWRQTRDTGSDQPQQVQVTEETPLPVQLIDGEDNDPQRVKIEGAVSDGWEPLQIGDSHLNDSDKTYTVPSGLLHQPIGIYVSLVTSSDAGDRQLCVLFTDGFDNVIGEARAGVVQAASLTRTYNFMLGVADLTSFRDTDHLTIPLPVLILPAGYKIRVYDNNAVAAAADDMTVRIMVQSRSV